MSALIISTLRDKRLEVADAIERLERQVDQHRAEATKRVAHPFELGGSRPIVQSA